MNTKPFRPLLAATIDNDQELEQLQYPLIASPKVDGIRCVVHPLMGPITRSCKPIRNNHIRNKLTQYIGFDGEIVSGPITDSIHSTITIPEGFMVSPTSNVFNRTTTAVMTQTGRPDISFNAFDTVTSTEPYDTRLQEIEGIIANLNANSDFTIRLLPYRIVEDPQDVLGVEIDWLAQGFEGVMLRHPLGRYKQGRSTLKEQILMKLKRFTDAEAEIIGFEPLYHNTNPQTRNIQGLAERSDHKAGKVEAETLGNLIVRDLSGKFGQFAVGSGFDQSLREQIWNSRSGYLGRVVTYKYQKIGSLEAPRFPIFLRFREAE